MKAAEQGRVWTKALHADQVCLLWLAVLHRLSHHLLVLFVTPEYNRSTAGVLKNAIDNASRPYEQSAWKGKSAGVMGASVGAPGTSMALQHLRNILAYLDVPTLALCRCRDFLSDATI